MRFTIDLPNVEGDRRGPYLSDRDDQPFAWRIEADGQAIAFEPPAEPFGLNVTEVGVPGTDDGVYAWTPESQADWAEKVYRVLMPRPGSAASSGTTSRTGARSCPRAGWWTRRRSRSRPTSGSSGCWSRPGASPRLQARRLARPSARAPERSRSPTEAAAQARSDAQ